MRTTCGNVKNTLETVAFREFSHVKSLQKSEKNTVKTIAFREFFDVFTCEKLAKK